VNVDAAFLRTYGRSFQAAFGVWQQQVAA
jgi:hypothetical protein